MKTNKKRCQRCKKEKIKSSFIANTNLCKICKQEKNIVYYKKNNKRLNINASKKYWLLKNTNYNKWFLLYKKGKIEHKIKDKEFLENYKREHPCAKCGESDYRCIDLHHINPEIKKDVVSQMIGRYSRKKMLEEIEKCITLCANCHRKLHYELKKQTSAKMSTHN
jgi:hypothetical protein